VRPPKIKLNIMPRFAGDWRKSVIAAARDRDKRAANCHAMGMREPTSSPKTALLLTNLGTPQAPTSAAISHYLAEFLSDRRVVQIPRLLWWPLLHGLILPLRSGRVARKYAEIWLAEGSPLAVHMRHLAAAVQAQLPAIYVCDAMRYGQPALADRLAALPAQGIQRALVLPLYPQYSTTTTASVEDLVAARAPAGLRVEVACDYATDPDWVTAIADSIRAHWQIHGRGRVLLFSFHSIPQRLANGGDRYPQRCQASAEAIAQALGLAAGDWRLSYQSKFGREPWLTPATVDTLHTLAADGVEQVDVVCPGFAVDCLETLEEIAIKNASLFRAAGGRVLSYIPCLNASPAHAHALAVLARRHLGLA